VLALIRANRLPASFGDRLDTSVRAKYEEPGQTTPMFARNSRCKSALTDSLRTKRGYRRRHDRVGVWKLLHPFARPG
jgi:hypothetical protein